MYNPRKIHAQTLIKTLRDSIRINEQIKINQKKKNSYKYFGTILRFGSSAIFFNFFFFETYANQRFKIVGAIRNRY